jgi:hypothetical protein
MEPPFALSRANAIQAIQACSQLDQDKKKRPGWIPTTPICFTSLPTAYTETISSALSSAFATETYDEKGATLLC